MKKSGLQLGLNPWPRKVTVQTPLKSWLFQASIRNCLNCVYNCDDHSLLDNNRWLHSHRRVESGRNIQTPGCSWKWWYPTQQNQKEIRKEYLRRVRLILRTEVNGRNKIEGGNSLAVPVVQYSFGIIDWKISELKKFNTKHGHKLQTTQRRMLRSTWQYSRHTL